MFYLTCLFLFGVVVGLAAVASNPSPFFAALGLVMVAGMGCGVLVASGGTFLSLILFLIYLGGMLVVFAYSAALAADSHPETWASGSVLAVMMFYLVGAIFAGVMLVDNWDAPSASMVETACELGVGLGDAGGVALVFSLGGSLLGVAAWVLLLTLFVVLELTWGLSRGALRSV